MMNKVILIGRLTRDPELRYTQAGLAVATFTLATDKDLTKEKKKEMEEQGKATTDFIKVIVWGKIGETCAQYTGKGLLVAVEGRLNNKAPYEYEKDGKIYVSRENEVVADKVKFLEWKKDKEQSTNDLGFDGSGSDFGGGFPDDNDFPF